MGHWGDSGSQYGHLDNVSLFLVVRMVIWDMKVGHGGDSSSQNVYLVHVSGS